MGRVNRKEEKEQVLIPCIKVCKDLLVQGVIIQWRRLDVFDATHVPGAPDLELHVACDKVLWILLAECKRPDGGVISKSQKEYKDKYAQFDNVVYKIIRSKADLINAVEDINHHWSQQLDNAFSIFDV